MSGPFLSFQVVLGIDDLQTQAGEAGRTVITDPRWAGQDWQEASITPPVIPALDELEAILPPDSRAWNYWLTRRMIADMVSTPEGEGLPFSDLLYWSPEHGPANVFGFRIRRSLYDEAALHALALLHPEYQQPGWKCIPLRPISENLHPDARAYQRVSEVLAAAGGGGKGIVAVRRWINEGATPQQRSARRQSLAVAGRLSRSSRWGWENGYAFHMPTWGPVATYVLQNVGLNVRRWDVRLMLVWEWR